MEQKGKNLFIQDIYSEISVPFFHTWTIYKLGSVASVACFSCTAYGRLQMFPWKLSDQYITSNFSVEQQLNAVCRIQRTGLWARNSSQPKAAIVVRYFYEKMCRTSCRYAVTKYEQATTGQQASKFIKRKEQWKGRKNDFDSFLPILGWNVCQLTMGLILLLSFDSEGLDQCGFAPRNEHMETRPINLVVCLLGSIF